MTIDEENALVALGDLGTRCVQPIELHERVSTPSLESNLMCLSIRLQPELVRLLREGPTR